jgi:DNA polymerase III delta subunit
MYKVHPFYEKDVFRLVTAVVKRKIKKPPNELEDYYSKELKDLLWLLLSQVYFLILNKLR